MIGSREKEAKLKIEVFSLTGKRVLQRTLTGKQRTLTGKNETDLDISVLSGGIYQMGIFDGKETVSHKFVKE